MPVKRKEILHASDQQRRSHTPKSSRRVENQKSKVSAKSGDSLFVDSRRSGTPRGVGYTQKRTQSCNALTMISLVYYLRVIRDTSFENEPKTRKIMITI